MAFSHCYYDPQCLLSIELVQKCLQQELLDEGRRSMNAFPSSTYKFCLVTEKWGLKDLLIDRCWIIRNKKKKKERRQLALIRKPKLG